MSESAYYSDDDLNLDIPAGSDNGIPPKPIQKENAHYPSDARKQGITGRVEVKMLVLKDGSVKRAKIAKSTNLIFNESALRAAMKWTFIPATENDKPINAWVIVPFLFSLDN